MSGRRLARSVAESVDAPAALFPYLGELFRGMPSLGSSPRRVVGLLKAHGITDRSRVVDLACGKGAAAMAIAGGIGCRVDAVDGYEPFLVEGRRNARRRGLDGLVTFEHADLERWGCDRAYDAALMLGLWPLDVAARSLRMCVRRGGLYVIDDVYYDQGMGAPPRGLARPPTMEECVGAIAELGDRVEQVHSFRPSEVAAINRRLFARLKVNAARLGRGVPGLRPVIREYLARQKAANEVLAGSFRPGVWVVRRGR